MRGTIEMGRLVANWQYLTPPPSNVYFLKKGYHKQSRLFCSTADLSPDEAPDG